SECYPPLIGRFPTSYSPVRHSSSHCKQSVSAFDFRVLGMPPAFVLSQDHTLSFSLYWTDASQPVRFSSLYFIKLSCVVLTINRLDRRPLHILVVLLCSVFKDLYFI